MRVEIFRRQIASCGDTRDAKEYPIEPSVIDETPLALVNRPITAFDDVTFVKREKKWQHTQFVVNQNKSSMT